MHTSSLVSIYGESATPYNSVIQIKNQPLLMSSTQNNNRRFNDDQVKSLETTFETESKPELPLKKHLANELGLQPRQVAIWFQNKRARSKSKQIERDYTILKSNYDNLALQLEALNKENQSLLTKVERLRNMAG